MENKLKINKNEYLGTMGRGAGEGSDRRRIYGQPPIGLPPCRPPHVGMWTYGPVGDGLI